MGAPPIPDNINTGQGVDGFGIGYFSRHIPLSKGGWFLPGVAVQADFSRSLYYGGDLTSMLTTARAAPALTYGKNADGTLLPFAANTPRVTTLGLLQEPSAENRILQSQDLTTTWTTSAANVTANAGLAPDGTTTADKVVPTPFAGTHLVQQSGISVTAVAQCVSIYARPSGYPKLGWREGAASGKWASFDLRGAGEVIATDTGVTASVEAMADGWYRVSVVYTPSGAGSHGYQWFVLDVGYTASAGSPLGYSFTGDGTSGAFLWGAQAELGSRVTSYIPTTTVAVTRDHDEHTLIGPALAALQATAASAMVCTQPLGFVPTGGSRLIATPGPVPLNASSDTSAQNYNGTDFATATAPFSAKFSQDPMWSITSWDGAQTSVCVNGGAVVTAASGMSTIDSATLGVSAGGAISIGGYISRLAIWTKVLSESELQSISAPGATFDASAVEAWGDSLTGGNQDGTGVSWPSVLAGLLGRAVYNEGVGGNTSTQILARATAFPAGFGSPNIFMMGRNDYSDPTTVKANIASAVAQLTTEHYLVGGVLPASSDSAPQVAGIATLNSDLATTYGVRFVDLLGPLQAASDGSAGDIADVAAGLVPRSLRVDAVHLNAAGYTIVAQAYYDKRSYLGL